MSISPVADQLHRVAWVWRRASRCMVLHGVARTRADAAMADHRDFAARLRLALKQAKVSPPAQDGHSDGCSFGALLGAGCVPSPACLIRPEWTT